MLWYPPWKRYTAWRPKGSQRRTWIWDGLAEKQEKYASWDWLYEKRIQFQYQASKRFPWGGMELWFQVRGGRIRALKVYSDSLKPGLMEIIEDSLTGVCYNRDDLLAAMGEIPGSSREETTMLQDLEDWFRQHGVVEKRKGKDGTTL